MRKPYGIVFNALLIAGMATAALAEAPLTPKAQYGADNKKALTRYAEDKKLCNDEPTSNARLQCRRDAKAEYDKALAAAKAHMATTTATTARPAKAHESKVACPDCGKVVAINMTEKEGEGGAAGILAGGAAGAVLGHQVGGGIGKDLATIAGAVGGAYAGKKIEEKIRTHKVWRVSVRYADGGTRSFEFVQEPGLKVGDAVKNAGNTIVRE